MEMAVEKDEHKFSQWVDGEDSCSGSFPKHFEGSKAWLARFLQVLFLHDDKKKSLVVNF